MIRQVRTRTTVARTLSNLATGPKGTYPQPMSTHLSLLPNCRASGALCIQNKFSCLFAGFSIQKRSNGLCDTLNYLDNCQTIFWIIIFGPLFLDNFQFDYFDFVLMIFWFWMLWTQTPETLDTFHSCFNSASFSQGRSSFDLVLISVGPPCMNYKI